MAGICFFFEDSDVDVWSGKDLDAWNYAIKAAGDVDNMIVVNKTDQYLQSPDVNLGFQVVNELPELENATFIKCPWDSGENISLWDFDHNTDWYVFGPASGWGGVDGVCIPQNGIGACHSVHIATTVMFHRYQTIWQ